jgi:hypothetical protein
MERPIFKLERPKAERPKVERPVKDAPRKAAYSGASATQIKERRAASRKPIIATANVIEMGSGAKLRARSCDLVVQGCYVDTMNPFPAGTQVRIRLEKGKSSFEARGRVVYRLSGLGMGIAFSDVTGDNKAVLENWLNQTGPDDTSNFEASLIPLPAEEEPKSKSHLPQQIVDLIEMLERKGIISRTEAALLLRPPAE